MFRSVKAKGMLGMLALAAGIQWAVADARPNPYGQIVDRNVFGLKPPPPPQVDAPKEEPKPPPNVKLTGISNLAQKRAFIEVTEQAPKPGQPPGTVNRPILNEGEAAYGVEVLSIDVEKSIVRIRNAGVESDLTFEVPKSTTNAAPAPYSLGPQPHSTGVPAAAAQPTVIGSPNAQMGGGGGVTLYGGSNSGLTNSFGVTTYGGANPPVPSPLGAESGTLRTIPSRTIRTPNALDQQQTDAARQAALMELNRAAAGRSRSSIPPTPVPPSFQPDNPQNPPAPLPQ
jgi:hypothetical protein